MKKALLFFFIITGLCYHSYSQNVGIGTINPLARLHVTDSNVIFTATAISDRPASVYVPVSGSGTRLMWIPQLSAFRAGTVTGTTWNTDSIGLFSFATGINTMATGIASTVTGQYTYAGGLGSFAAGGLSQAFGSYSAAIGFTTAAVGNGSTALGSETQTLGNFSFAAGKTSIAYGNTAVAVGNNAQASGDYSLALGKDTKASSLGAIALGNNTKASGLISTAMGAGTVASGNGSTAMGSGTVASGTVSTAMGGNTKAASYVSVSIGQYNDTIAGSSATTWVNTDPLLYIGNGDNPDFVHNAMVVYKNGDADMNGYVRLGEASNGSPRIKVKKLTTVMPSSQGAFTMVAHGITQSKILSISALATVGQYQIIPNHPQTGFQYTLNVDGANIAVGAVGGNSASLLNAPVKILITYEE